MLAPCLVSTRPHFPCELVTCNCGVNLEKYFLCCLGTSKGYGRSVHITHRQNYSFLARDISVLPVTLTVSIVLVAKSLKEDLTLKLGQSLLV
jgi:hypothetical protein